MLETTAVGPAVNTLVLASFVLTAGSSGYAGCRHGQLGGYISAVYLMKEKLLRGIIGTTKTT